jgi:CheY-like chemotaxis protein
LISNAIRFTPAGFVEFGYRLLNNQIQFFVHDTGIGISPERLKTMFDRFKTLQQEATKIFSGSGLGLVISKKIIQLLGGDIQVDSTLNKGTTFLFDLPLIQIESELKSLESEPNRNYQYFNWKDKTILIAEDERANFRFIEAVLTRTNVNILWAKDGKKAIELLSENPQINIIIMDMKMPEMDGYEATRNIRTYNKKLPIVALTAYAMSGDREKSLDAGCTDFVTKPVTPEQLLDTIAKYL